MGHSPTPPGSPGGDFIEIYRFPSGRNKTNSPSGEYITKITNFFIVKYFQRKRYLFTQNTPL